MLVRRGYISILFQERTRLYPVSGEDTPRSCLRRGHISILFQERTRLYPVSGEDTPRAAPDTADTPILPIFAVTISATIRYRRHISLPLRSPISLQLCRYRIGK